MNNKDKKLISNYLKTQKLMSLGTCGKQLWAASVYYLHNDDLEIYFLSPTSSEHCMNIGRNPGVSLTITDSNQKHSDKKIGIQIRGNAKQVKSKLEALRIIKMWNSKYRGLPVKYAIMMKKWESRFYKIEISRIKFFNEELYGPEGDKLFEL